MQTTAGGRGNSRWHYAHTGVGGGKLRVPQQRAVLQSPPSRSCSAPCPCPSPPQLLPHPHPIILRSSS
eukprot:752906-Hanusia_phi.AAC.4